ncbi:uncharacterized protein LOC114319568 isoform X2 [Camellia sinensis]|uniref:uncharacterized protein LOC114319568 isoform X2 n=1 Tax=Camellia sinensis TaxID=4442 RepID=UPI0010369BA0|nr:uncharacterized protein LOC114319568 isoform X2 [Camellia sinensis]XP_028122397.1 uncharacterized protein LOC114319568 isoform X2 [Camellia sinensis]
MFLSLNRSISLFLSRCLNLSSSLDLSISLSYDLARSLYLCTSLAAICAIHQYQVVGRALPMETDQHPKIYRMKLWATNEVRAKSKFWYFLRKLKKVKKSNGQMLAINEVLDEIRVDVASQLSAGIQRKNSWKEDRGC